MSTIQQEFGIIGVTPADAPQHYSTVVEFVNEATDRGPDETPTTVEIYANGDRWYCHVRRGDQKTQPMGPYTKQQAERIQDARRMLIAKRGIANLSLK
jgi:hypothetical protein